jgi:OOP family OmpA-OmpF porin
MILDASGSMRESYKGKQKLDIAKDTAAMLNMTIPEGAFMGGLDVFGNTYNPFGSKTEVLYGLTRHSHQGLSDALGQVKVPGGRSPLSAANEQVADEFESLSGKTAVLLLTDAKNINAANALEKAQRLKNAFGKDICFYPILIGNDAGGRALMEQIAQVGQCGFFVAADALASGASSAAYVERVFFEAGAPRMADSDRDGVWDDKDQCPNTPAGVRVDPVGCPLDSDKDGVPDYQDRCPGTPVNVAVDPFGCPLDSDKDGVPDYLDRCPGTPKWTDVDAQGCPLDSDGDGITDDKDQCPGTPQGAKVNSVGCWVLGSVLFDTGKATIKPSMTGELDNVVRVLNANPDVKIQVIGHTDSVGSAASNQKLSEARAKSVMAYLIDNGISRLRVTAQGLGETRPMATNDTAGGRAMNRRVELMPVQ